MVNLLRFVSLLLLGETLCFAREQVNQVDGGLPIRSRERHDDEVNVAFRGDPQPRVQRLCGHRRFRLLAHPAQQFLRTQHAAESQFGERSRPERLAEFRGLKRILALVANKLHCGGVRGACGSEAENQTQQSQSASAHCQPVPAQAQRFNQTPWIERQIVQEIRMPGSPRRSRRARPRRWTVGRCAGLMRTVRRRATVNRQQI